MHIITVNPLKIIPEDFMNFLLLFWGFYLLVTCSTQVLMRFSSSFYSPTCNCYEYPQNISLISEPHTKHYSRLLLQDPTRATLSTLLLNRLSSTTYSSSNCFSQFSSLLGYPHHIHWFIHSLYIWFPWGTVLSSVRQFGE